MKEEVAGSSGGGEGSAGIVGGVGGQESKFEQLMVNMLDERDKLLEQLQESQRRLEVHFCFFSALFDTLLSTPVSPPGLGQPKAYVTLPPHTP